MPFGLFVRITEMYTEPLEHLISTVKYLYCFQFKTESGSTINLLQEEIPPLPSASVSHH